METVLIVLVCCTVIALVVPITIAVEKQRSRRNKFEEHFELVFGLVSLGLFFIFQRGFLLFIAVFWLVAYVVSLLVRRKIKSDKAQQEKR